MKVYFASDHAGFELKNILLGYVRDELGYEVEDRGAHELDPADDYPEFVKKAAQAVSEDPENRKAVILGGSGQGEAMTANRFSGVRAVVFYGEAGKKQTDVTGDELDMLVSTRLHNDANVLSLAARFVDHDESCAAVRTWLETEFSGDERHVRRIRQIDTQ